MLPHLLSRTTMKTTAFLFLLFFSFSLGPVPIMASTGAGQPDPAPFILDIYYYDTFDGTLRQSASYSAYYGDSFWCRTQYQRYDEISLTFRDSLKFTGWDNIDCTGEPLFEFQRENVSYFEPPKTWQAWKVEDL